MTQSALAAGYTPSMAHSASTKLEPQHNVSIKEALNAVGAHNVRLAEVIVAGLTAADPEGNVNFRERREYTKLALEAKGELKTGSTALVQINFPAGLAELFTLDAGEFGKED